jgi:sensor histidine kinase regulating citrate/malate metabolism
MVIWWIGNIVLLVVIAPVVVLLLFSVLKAALTVRRAVDDIATVGAKMVSDLEPVPELIKTENYVSQTTAGLSRYGAALDEIL